MKKYLLAHDLGTSGNKATLYSTEGELVKRTASGGFLERCLHLHKRAGTGHRRE